jgi:hypothetical protein
MGRQPLHLAGLGRRQETRNRPDAPNIPRGVRYDRGSQLSKCQHGVSAGSTSSSACYMSTIPMPRWASCQFAAVPLNRRSQWIVGHGACRNSCSLAEHLCTLPTLCSTNASRSVNIGNANEVTWRRELRLPGTLLQSDPPTFVTEKSLLEAENAWDTVISGYSKRGITDPRDKLVALHGIAEVFHRFWSTSKYLAGLWERNLLEELLWQKSEEDRFPRPAVYRAPSWSWAAIDGHITPAFSMHYWGEDKPECEILQCEVTLASEILPFGEVTSGFLVLNAVLKKVLWGPAEGKCSPSRPRLPTLAKLLR